VSRHGGQVQAAGRRLPDAACRLPDADPLSPYPL